MRFNKDLLDSEILKEIGHWNAYPTYIIRNKLDWPGKPFYRQGLKTRHVLTACKRLEKQGKLEQVLTSYAVMKCWALTDEAVKDIHQSKPID